MSERKVLNKYYEPDFNPELLKKQRVSSKKQVNVRMMTPFKMTCDICGNILYWGTKYNMRKEECDDEDYLGISIFRFYMKCTYCLSEISFKTDPKNHGYVCENGATRSYEGWKDARAAEYIMKEIRQKEEEGNTIKFIENRTYDSKKELEMIDAIEEIRVDSNIRNKINEDNILNKLKNNDLKHVKLIKKLITKDISNDDIFFKKKIIKVKKISKNKLVDISESE